MFVQGIRGATTVRFDEIQEVKLKTQRLLEEIIEKNNLTPNQIVYILFTATDDIKSVYPALAAREMGLDNVPLLCCQEMDVLGSLNNCIRVLMLVQRSEETKVFHVYQEKAVTLRPDLME